MTAWADGSRWLSVLCSADSSVHAAFEVIWCWTHSQPKRMPGRGEARGRCGPSLPAKSGGRNHHNSDFSTSDGHSHGHGSIARTWGSGVCRIPHWRSANLGKGYLTWGTQNFRFSPGLLILTEADSLQPGSMVPLPLFKRKELPTEAFQPFEL